MVTVVVVVVDAAAVGAEVVETIIMGPLAVVAVTIVVVVAVAAAVGVVVVVVIVICIGFKVSQTPYASICAQSDSDTRDCVWINILQFMQKREKYVQVHLDAGLDKIRLRTLVSMFEQVFLETICQYELGISFIEVTEKDLED